MTFRSGIVPSGIGTGMLNTSPSNCQRELPVPDRRQSGPANTTTQFPELGIRRHRQITHDIKPPTPWFARSAAIKERRKLMLEYSVGVVSPGRGVEV